jgi:Mor family transcriptional regulator
MKKLAVAVMSLALAAFLGVEFATPAFAAKVDCDQVMSELNSGKKVAEVAKDLKVSKSSVYRCRKRAKKAEKEKAEAAPAAAASAAAAPAAAAPAPAASPAEKK